MRVALVHDWLTGMRGGEKVLEAIAELFPEAPIYTLFCFEDAISEKLGNHPIHTSSLQGLIPDSVLRRYYRYLLPTFPAAIEDFDLTGFDLVISTSHCVAKGAIPGPEAVHLCYCHSPMRYAWDMEHQYFPKRRGILAEIRSELLSRLRTWDVASCPRVDHFWANSSFVARRLRRYYGRDSEVLHPPVDVAGFSSVRSEQTEASTGSNHPISSPSDLSGRDDAPNEPIAAEQSTAGKGDYALAVSALVPYKRLDLAIQAAERAGLELRIVGTGPEAGRLAAMCRRHARLLGRVDDTELRRLYREARLFLQTGIEDFGIAAVEALASGTPVVALGSGGIADIVDDGRHGLLYQGFQVSDVVTAIDKSSGIRFNPLELERRAQSFTTERFLDRLRASIRGHIGEIRGVESAPSTLL
ncbi:MAG: glycosyltransferase [Holophagales bacterium]|nr:glycosyltransferase [Holophagales bacterium]